MNFSIILNSTTTPTTIKMSANDIFVMFSGLTFDQFQDKLIALVTREKMHAQIINTRGNEIMEMRFSPNSPEGICCMWQSHARLNRFINSFAK